MNRIVLTFLFLSVFSMMFFSCHSKSKQEEANESALKLVDSLYIEYLNKITILQDSMLVAMSNDDIDLGMACLYKIDVAFTNMLNDFGDAAYVPAYIPLERDSVWSWLKEKHYNEASIYMRHRDDIFGIEENPLE